MMQTDAVTAATFLTPAGLLSHWQGHRRLTRRVIEAFPEDQLFTFSLGGMRPFGVMAWEIHQVSELTLRGLLSGEWPMPDWRGGVASDKSELLSAWDTLTAQIEQELLQVNPAFYERQHALPWGEMPGWVAAIYAVDNEVHHRGEGYVYLRALGIEPPAFYER
ncbi:damage-inducible protein DinB [Deinococcus irradiatisoli]|uniref:Damage-inducible protein DinB n=1 Tax=Deinococcus irradiatisoli TaxID=2202254 RepID=A0A2Z3JJJ2_9DEIO|nr:DinB family protein [Deinococcus irradiatisoli]AWN24156.1 damage-inducible protein DinB [Deinococcus irradiatisoli]